LIQKLKDGDVEELVFALNTTMEGDTTNFYLYRKIKDFNVKLTTIARGISVGDELEFADEVTLGRSIQQRIPYEQSLPK
jgi:recombination protein RecR